MFAGEHIENTLEALRALIQKDNATPGGLKSLAYIEFDVHVRSPRYFFSTCHTCIVTCAKYLHAVAATLRTHVDSLLVRQQLMLHAKVWKRSM